MVITTLPQDLEYFSMRLCRCTSEVAKLLERMSYANHPAYASLYNIYAKLQTLDEDFYSYTQKL